MDLGSALITFAHGAASPIQDLAWTIGPWGPDEDPSTTRSRFGVDENALCFQAGAVYGGAASLLAGGLGGRAAAGGYGAARLGKLTIEDLFANPGMLKGVKPETLKKLLKLPPGWRIETLGKGTHKGQGWMIRRYGNKGEPTGEQIRWHPGGGRHGPDPYWRVIDKNTKGERIPG